MAKKTKPPQARKLAKVATKAAIGTSPPAPLSVVELGQELSPDPDDLLPTKSPYPPLDPLHDDNFIPKDSDYRGLDKDSSRMSPSAEEDNEEQEEEDEEGKKAARMSWTYEMKEQLVEVLYQVFHDGGAADNSFKKSIFEKAAVQVRKVYTGTYEITWTKCKNQWADLKAKWAYWTFLSKQSGAGFNENTELYEFYDYVWESLNRSHPKIIWHKTHIMPFREMISYILSDVQANGDGAFSLAEATLSIPASFFTILQDALVHLRQPSRQVVEAHIISQRRE
jgi:hypothetical protein